MKKYIITLIYLLFISAYSQAQDVEIFLSKESINSSVNALSHAGLFNYGERKNQIDPKSGLDIDQYSVGFHDIDIQFGLNNSFILTATNVDLWLDSKLVVEYWEDIVFTRHSLLTVTLLGSIDTVIKNDSLFLKLSFSKKNIEGNLLIWLANIFNMIPNPEPKYLPIKYPHKSDVYDISVQPVFLVNNSGVTIKLRLKATPATIELANNVALSEQISYLKVKKSIDQSWSKGIRSGFAVFDTWNESDTYHAKILDRIIQFSGKNYLFEFVDEVHSRNDLKLKILSGERQFEIVPNSIDVKFSARYLRSQFLSFNNEFEYISSIKGKINFENTLEDSFNDYYRWDVVMTRSLKAIPNTTLGLSWQFLNWSDGVTTADRTVLVDRDITLTANWKAMLASKTGNWVQQTALNTFNGTSAVAYLSKEGSETYSWFHSETSAGTKEIQIGGSYGYDPENPGYKNALAVADYNHIKQYVGYIAVDAGIGFAIEIEEYVNGIKTKTMYTDYVNCSPDLGGITISQNAKLYISPYQNSNSWPQTYNKFLVVVVDGLKVFTKQAAMEGDNIQSWGTWSSFTVNSTPVVSTNGKTAYITWLQNGNLVGRKFVNSSWGSTYTIYSNTGGNFINFSATVNATDDLILMMTRYNSEEQIKSACFGKRYFNGNLSPLTVLENLINFGDYDAYSVASEGNKLLVSMGKRNKTETSCKYYLWKNDGTSWIKETTAFSSTPARLLHNEVDVRPYEFVTATTPALYALKTTPVSWPAGANMNKDGDENGFSIVAAQIGDTLNWYTTVSPETVDSIVIDSTGIWSIVVNQVSAKSLLIAGLNRFGSALWVDTSSTVVFTPATARYTFWVVDPAGNKMRVHKESSETEDAEFVLENKISVFPNPFNPETVFSISVAERSTVKLHVFNLIGQQIAEVVNADLNAGVHDYRLNAGFWSSGTYFYRLQIGEKTKTGKIQLVK